jgi:streptomycin 6-kinase
VAECAERWSLRLEQPYAGHVSLAVPAGEAVLKINFPHPESAREPDALAHWDGDGAARLLARDDERRALLIERCRPGTQAWAESDEAATRAAADVLARLHAKPAPPRPGDAPRDGFFALADAALAWAREIPARWERHGRPCERALIDRAVSALPQLAATQARLVVCHQDLHGGNLLTSARGWLAIDPKPLAGEPAFDCASLIRDRRDTHLEARTLERRLSTLSDALELDRERVREWAIAHALAWGLEDEAVHPMHLECARLLAG